MWKLHECALTQRTMLALGNWLYFLSVGSWSVTRVALCILWHENMKNDSKIVCSYKTHFQRRWASNKRVKCQLAHELSAVYLKSLSPNSRTVRSGAAWAGELWTLNLELMYFSRWSGTMIWSILESDINLWFLTVLLLISELINGSADSTNLISIVLVYKYEQAIWLLDWFLISDFWFDFRLQYTRF